MEFKNYTAASFLSVFFVPSTLLLNTYVAYIVALL